MEMGDLEVELEEQLAGGAGLTEDKDFGADDLEIHTGLVANARRKDGEFPEESKSDYTDSMTNAAVSPG